MERREAVTLRDPIWDLLEQRHEPGVAELCGLLLEWLGDGLDPESVQIERLTRGVYRLRTGAGSGQSYVMKAHPPAIAQTDRLVLERWLPALGLGAHAPRLLAAVAQREGRAVWHIYEDLRGETLVDRRETRYVEPAVDLIAELHTRAAGHRLLAEVRWEGRDHGAHGLPSSLRDAILTLEAVGIVWDRDDEFAIARRRLVERLHRLVEEAPGRVHALEVAGGPATLLHGDLWPKNVFVATEGQGAPVRLIDWDHVGVGSFTYDLSTLLYQSAVVERPWLLQRYRTAVERATGWRLAPDSDLNLMFHTAEIGRGATSILWPALALVNDGAPWGRTQLVELERWFSRLRPPLESDT